MTGPEGTDSRQDEPDLAALREQIDYLANRPVWHNVVQNGVAIGVDRRHVIVRETRAVLGRFDDLAARNQALEKALIKYGVHRKLCAVVYDHERDCDCGLAEALGPAGVLVDPKEPA